MSGLQLGLNVDQADYTYASSASVGFRVSNVLYFKTKQTKPNIVNIGIAVTVAV